MQETMISPFFGKLWSLKFAGDPSRTSSAATTESNTATQTVNIRSIHNSTFA